MVSGAYTNYFLGSAGASAALIGLLFVAVSLAPTRIVGRESTPERRAQAGSAFMALLDAFFVSMVALIPDTNVGYAALILAVIGIVNTLSLGRHFWDAWRAGQQPKRLTLLLVSLLIYGWQLWYAVALLQRGQDANAVQGLASVLLGAYAVGLGRAWALLGAPDEGLLTLFGIRHDRGEAPPSREAEAGTQPEDDPVTQPKAPSDA